MVRILGGLIVAFVVGLAAQEAKAQYYIPSTVPVFAPQYSVPFVYNSVPRYDYRYYPRRRYRSRYYPSYRVYVVPATTVQRPSITTRSRPSGVHPSQYIGDPHASQYIGDPHASQFTP